MNRQMINVSGAVHTHGILEAQSTFYWSKLTRQCCEAGGLVLDVGSNMGEFSIAAARLLPVCACEVSVFV